MIHVIFTGGTIASAVNPATGAAEATVTGERILQQVPGLDQLGVTIRAEQVGNKAGNALSLDEMLGFALRVKEVLADPDVEGAVIVQGTATMADTAFLCDLVVDSSKPLVITGAMYNQSYPDTDGPRNVLNAIRVAASPDAHDMGVMICLNAEIHAARDAVKSHSFRLNSFISYEHGLLGNADVDRVVFYRRPLRRLNLPATQVVGPVDVVKVVAGGDSRLIRAAVATGAKGIVVESIPGSGGIVPGFIEGLREAVAAVPVIICTACPTGRVGAVYGSGTGSKDVLAMGVLAGGDLSVNKARVFLSLALGLTEDRAQLGEWLQVLTP